MSTWADLSWWKSVHAKIAKEKLDAEDKSGKTVNPQRSLTFISLYATPFKTVRVCLVGQDPYPDPKMCTGLAFSIPKNIPVDKWPASLVNILTEYTHNTGYPWPLSGDLSAWTKQGVLLWNCFPSCEAWKPASHRWPEWEELTKEIVKKLDDRGGCVFLFLGAHARKCVDIGLKSPWFTTSHPSPRGYHQGFKGSRIFNVCNGMLMADLGLTPIDWRLPHAVPSRRKGDSTL